MGFLGDLFNGGYDEVIFFILVFIFLFSENKFRQEGEKRVQDSDSTDNSLILFFIILFALLFISTGIT